MQSDDRQILAKRYEKIHLAISLAETVISIAVILWFVLFGYSQELRDLVSAWSANPYIQLLVFLALIGLAFSVVDLPLSFFTGFWLEHYFELSNQSFGRWLWESLKGFLVSIVLLTPVVLIFYYLLLHFPETWWLWTACVLFVFSVILGRIAPQVIFPLFYKFESLNDEELTGRMKRLAELGKFKLQGVFRFNMSKNTKKANAAFTGLGKSRRIILGDTLLEKFTPDEIETVFAHEVGHFVHGHLWQHVLAETALSFFSLWLTDFIYQSLIGRMEFNGLADLAALPLLSVILAILGFLSQPLSNMLSRHHERQADRYAVSNAQNPAAFASALHKLSDVNLADREPHPLVEFLFHSHPSIQKRVAFCNRLMAEQNYPM